MSPELRIFVSAIKLNKISLSFNFKTMSFLRFVRTVHFWKHLGLMAAAGFLIVWLITIFLNLFTFHGQSIEVPDFKGMTMEEIENMDGSGRFDYVVVDSVFDLARKPGSVISQLPYSGSHVKKGRSIYLTLVASEPEATKLPNLVDMTARQATALLETYGLRVGKIKYVPDIGQTVLKAICKGKEISWGTELPKGSKVDLVIGRGGKGEKVIIPDLVGKSRDEARNTITGLGLNVGSEVFKSKRDTLKVKVVKQKPSASGENEINVGETIDLWYE